MKTYTINTSGLSYALIMFGIKKVECKINRGIYSDMNVGDTIIWTNELFYSKSIRTTIINKSYHYSFREYSIFLNPLLCGSRNETIYGVTAITFKKEDETDLVEIPIQTILI
jgi:ASC-1-like (ASCH) protein